MGEVEILINEEGALKVVQHYDLRVLLRRLRPEGFVRHRVVRWPSCKCGTKMDSEAQFNRVLKFFFLITLSLAVISIVIFEQLLTHSRPPDESSTWDYIFEQTWLFGHFQITRRGIILLALFAAILAVGVLMKKVATKNARSASQRREEVQTVSALVQQV